VIQTIRLPSKLCKRTKQLSVSWFINSKNKCKTNERKVDLKVREKRTMRARESFKSHPERFRPKDYHQSCEKEQIG
jgi:hypothetical protein